MKKWIIGLSIFMALLFAVGVAFIVAGLQREPVVDMQQMQREMIEASMTRASAYIQPQPVSSGWEAANV